MVTALLAGKPLSHNKALLLVAISAILWSTSGLFIKIIDLNPLTIAGTRSAIAALVVIIIINKSLRFNWSYPQVAGALAYSATLILFVSATKLTTAANAILLQYTVPVFTALLGVWLLKEKVTHFDWGIICIVLGGMALFFLDRLSPVGLWGNIMGIISAITFAFAILYMRMQKSGSPVETVILGNVITAIICLPFMIKSPPTSASWWPLIFLGIFQLGLPFLLYSVAIKYVTALDAVLIQTVEPLLNPIWVFLVVGESPGKWAVIGGIIVLSAVTIRNLFSNKRIPKPLAN